MNNLKILVIGGGIGGLTAAIALRRKGFGVEVIEKDPTWSVYGVGIIQQSNVVRAMTELGILEDYLGAAFGFDFIEIFTPGGEWVARLPAPKLVEGYPASMGISRPALHKVLCDRTTASGATVRLGLTASALEDTGEGVNATFSDGSSGAYDLVIGADGLYSTTREMIFPEAPKPRFTGQSVWRYNFPRQEGVDCLRAYEGPVGIGLVPLSQSLMYMYVTTPEPGNPRYPVEGLAAVLRSKLADAPRAIASLAERITDDKAVVYKPQECLFLTGAWHKGRIVLIGDAIHATTPHLGQGAAMAIEDAVVLAEELVASDAPEQGFRAFRDRRFARCDFTVRASESICRAQLGEGPPVDMGALTLEMFEVMAQPI